MFVCLEKLKLKLKLKRIFVLYPPNDDMAGLYFFIDTDELQLDNSR